ncbi:hypothetical protein HNQ57_002012 [Zhongshania antarctica]|uniref:Uncharacterized protein n=1 Tax=Zhongshania antarctica TaxID=641702 RepID=A0A840R590_9GAMM|nr:hypothetical protein [Zhongshania antarctica]MBB5187734.1 hypothetical protein [Zhongshania antarctica]
MEEYGVFFAIPAQERRVEDYGVFAVIPAKAGIHMSAANALNNMTSPVLLATIRQILYGAHVCH